MNNAAPVALGSRAAEKPDGLVHRWKALLIVLSAMFVALMDVFIANIAIPSLQVDLKATAAQIEWVSLSYTLAYGALLILGGRVGDRFGRDRVFLIGMSIFCLGSLLCGIAPDIWFLIGARGVQGIGAAFMVPQVFATIQSIFRGEERSKALALYGGTVGLASIAGQVLGGLLIGAHSGGPEWRYLFLLNLPIGLCALLAGSLFLPRMTKGTERRIDISGAALSLLFLLALLLPLAELSKRIPSSGALALLALSPLTLAFFIRHEVAVLRKGSEPLLDGRLLTDTRFMAGTLIVCAAQSALAGLLFLFSVFYQREFGVSPRIVSFALIAPGFGYGLASLFSPKAIEHYGRGVMLLGGLLCIIGYLTLAGVAILAEGGRAIQLVASAMPMLAIGIATGFVFTPTINLATSGLSPDLTGAASGVIPTSIQGGNLLGVAVIGSLYFHLVEIGCKQVHAFAVCCGAMAVFAAICLVNIHVLLKELSKPLRIFNG